MTTGIHQILVLRILVVSLACPEAFMLPVVSKAMVTAATGGVLPLQAAPLRGYEGCTTTTAVSIGTSTAVSSASLLVASGIKILDI